LEVSAAHIRLLITVCSESEAKLPDFSGVTTRLHWSFPDPAKFTGTHAEKLAKTRGLLEEIRAKMEEFCAEYCELDLQT